MAIYMEKKSTDRRVRKTKKLLLSGLTQLMSEKSVKDITVRELSDLVDINRGTFYLHYRDIYDMVEQIQQEMFENFYSVISKHSPKELNDQPLPLLIDVFQFIAENAEMSKVLLGKNGDIAFVDKLKDLVKDRCLNNYMEIFHKEETQNFGFFYSFIVSGCIGIIETWLQHDLKQSPEEMAVLAGEIIMHGIKVLQ